MSPVADSRKQVLERIRAATTASPRRDSGATEGKAAETRDYVRQGQMTASARCERFIERLREYDADVMECAPDGLAAAIATQLRASGGRTFVAPAGLPAEWRAPGFEWKIDNHLDVRDVEHADGVVTACFCGVADSGTIVLHHGPAEGRRVISLLPDWHLCVVRASQVVETLPEYFERCTTEDWVSGAGDRGRTGLPRLVTWIAGPSATADIEMTRIKGVHGPRFLNIILVRDEE